MKATLTARQMEAILHSPYQSSDDEVAGADIMVTLLGHLKALYWFYWTAHWQTAGPNSYSDHLMFERMKDALVDEIDTLAEKAVGYYGAGAVDPAHVMKHEHEGMAPARREGDFPAEALKLERNFQLYLSHAYDTLKNLKLLPMGLDDFLMSMSGTHDTHVYLLQQRTGGVGTLGPKTAGRRKSAVMNSLEKSWLGESTFGPHRHAEDGDELEAAWAGHTCGPGGA